MTTFITEDMINEQFRLLDERGTIYKFSTIKDKKYVQIGNNDLQYGMDELFGCICEYCQKTEQIREGCECWLGNFDWVVYVGEGKQLQYAKKPSVNSLAQRVLTMPIKLY